MNRRITVADFTKQPRNYFKISNPSRISGNKNFQKNNDITA